MTTTAVPLSVPIGAIPLTLQSPQASIGANPNQNPIQQAALKAMDKTAQAAHSKEAYNAAGIAASSSSKSEEVNKKTEAVAKDIKIIEAAAKDKGMASQEKIKKLSCDIDELLAKILAGPPESPINLNLAINQASISRISGIVEPLISLVGAQRFRMDDPGNYPLFVKIFFRMFNNKLNLSLFQERSEAGEKALEATAEVRKKEDEILIARLNVCVSSETIKKRDAWFENVDFSAEFFEKLVKEMEQEKMYAVDSFSFLIRSSMPGYFYQQLKTNKLFDTSFLEMADQHFRRAFIFSPNMFRNRMEITVTLVCLLLFHRKDVMNDPGFVTRLCASRTSAEILMMMEILVNYGINLGNTWQAIAENMTLEVLHGLQINFLTSEMPVVVEKMMSKYKSDPLPMDQKLKVAARQRSFEIWKRIRSVVVEEILVGRIKVENAKQFFVFSPDWTSEENMAFLSTGINLEVGVIPQEDLQKFLEKNQISPKDVATILQDLPSIEDYQKQSFIAQMLMASEKEVAAKAKSTEKKINTKAELVEERVAVKPPT